MNNLLYARLAKTNLSKNRQNILPYLLSCIGTVVMFFIMDTLAQGSGFDSMIGKDTILTVMGMGTYIIGLFAVIFLIYSNSFLAKRRKKEFGLFQIHFGHAVPHEAKCGRSCEYLYSVNGCASGYLHQHMFVDGD